MSEYFDDIKIEFEFSTGVWTDVYDDVLSVITVSQGIRGTGPLDRVASTGKMTIALLNHDNTYTPDHSNCVSGFDKGTHCRLSVEDDSTTKVKFYGRIERIAIAKSEGLDYITTVDVYDYMGALATHELQLPEFAEDIRMDQVAMQIIDNMPIKPLSVESYTSQDVFATAFDTTKSTTKGLQELAKAAQSELGYVFMRHDAYGGTSEVLTLVVSGAGTTAVNGTYYYNNDMYSKPYFYKYKGLQDWYAIYWNSDRWTIMKALPETHLYQSTDDVATPDLVTTWTAVEGDLPLPTVVDAATVYDDEVFVAMGRYERPKMTSKATFTDEQIEQVRVEYGGQYYNDIKTVTYPRKVDATATTVLFTLNRYVAIDAGATAKVTGRFIDPNQEAQQVSGIEMVDPVATTDYLFNTATDGSGSNITADLDVVAVYGTNGVEYTLTNNNASIGYVTFLQARGKGVYTYRPVEYRQEYDAGITADGRMTLTLAMPYQHNPLVGEDFASGLLDMHKDKKLLITGITYSPNKSATLMGYFRDLYVGDRITLCLSDLGIDSDYFIQGVDFKIAVAGGATTCTYTVVSESMMPAADFWELDSATLSQLGETTKLGF